jgi:hypothetical protein
MTHYQHLKQSRRAITHGMIGNGSKVMFSATITLVTNVMSPKEKNQKLNSDNI